MCCPFSFFLWPILIGKQQDRFCHSSTPHLLSTYPECDPILGTEIQRQTGQMRSLSSQLVFAWRRQTVDMEQETWNISVHCKCNKEEKTEPLGIRGKEGVPLVRVPREEYLDEVKVLLDPFNLRKCLLGKCCSINTCSPHEIPRQGAWENVTMRTRTPLPLAQSPGLFTHYPVSLPGLPVREGQLPSFYRREDWGSKK